MIEGLLSESIENNCNSITERTPPVIAEEYEKNINDKSHVLQIIKIQKTIEIHVDNFNDEIHLDADKHHNEKKNYNAAMEKLGNVFKFMVPTLNAVEAELYRAKGYIKGKITSFAGISNILNAVEDIMKFIPIPLSLANLYLRKYDESEMLERADKMAL